MATLAFIHDRLSITVLLFMLGVGFWALWSYLRGEGVTGSLWGALVVGEILIVVEGLLGVTLYFGGYRPVRSAIHILYGIVLMMSLPAAFSYTRGRGTRAETLIYAIIALFLAGVSIRARLTGGG
jgi:hypothetical protein